MAVLYYSIMHLTIDTTTAPRTCHLIQAGCVDYQQASQWQRHYLAERSAGRCGDTLLLLEHPPTITLGRAAHRHHILLPAEELARRGVTLVESDRGGDVTYHAPGQLVGYPILKLVHYGIRVVDYVRNLEEVLIRTLATYEITAERVAGLTGVWAYHPRRPAAPPAKVAAIGVKFSASGITSHGFALNIAPDMRGFNLIIPCGITERGVTSLEMLLGSAPSRDEVTERLLACFAQVFGIATMEMETETETDRTETANQQTYEAP